MAVQHLIRLISRDYDWLTEVPDRQDRAPAKVIYIEDRANHDRFVRSGEMVVEVNGVDRVATVYRHENL